MDEIRHGGAGGIRLPGSRGGRALDRGRRFAHVGGGVSGLDDGDIGAAQVDARVLDVHAGEGGDAELLLDGWPLLP